MNDTINDGWVQVEADRWRRDYGGGVQGEVRAVAAGVYTGDTHSPWSKFHKELDTIHGQPLGREQAMEAVDLMYAANFAASIGEDGWRHVEAEKWVKHYGGGAFGEVWVFRPGLFHGRLWDMLPPGLEVKLPDMYAGIDALCRARQAVDGLAREYAPEDPQ